MWLLPAHANTPPAYGAYLAEGATQTANPAGLIVLTVAGGLDS